MSCFLRALSTSSFVTLPTLLLRRIRQVPYIANRTDGVHPYRIQRVERGDTREMHRPQT